MSNVHVIPAYKRRPHLKKIGIYARVSTARKEQLNSLSTQVSALTRHVSERNDWILRDIYMDVGSARTGSARKEFSRLMNDCRNHDLDYVITKSISRFGRDSVEIMDSVRRILSYGVKLYFMEEDIDADKDFDETDLSLYAAIHQSENEHRSENIKLGLKYRAENGTSKLYHKPCFGYVKDDEGNLIIDQSKATIVSHIYDLYLEGKSFSGIIEVLKQEQIPSPRGSGKWSKKSVETILTNVKYTGNVEVMKSDPGSNRYCMWGAHEAIVSMDRFKKVQEEISRRTKRKRLTESTSATFVNETNWPEPRKE